MLKRALKNDKINVKMLILQMKYYLFERRNGFDKKELEICIYRQGKGGRDSRGILP